MENNTLNELKKEIPTIEEQQAFVNKLVTRSKKRQEDLRIWTENFKKDHGLNNEID